MNRREAPFAPQVPRIPLPEHEPVPSTPWGPNPEYGDLPQRAGDLSVGYITGINGRDTRKRKKKIPFGFRLERA